MPLKMLATIDRNHAPDKPGRVHEKRKPGRPKKADGHGGYCDAKTFFKDIREQLTPKELSIFKTSDERLRSLSTEECKDGLYPKNAQAVRRIVDKVKASVIKVAYMQECLGIEKHAYDTFIRYVKMDAVGKDSILAEKNYGITRHFRERYKMQGDKPIMKAGIKDRGLTLEQFEDLIKIMIHDREALLNKFQKSRKKP